MEKADLETQLEDTDTIRAQFYKKHNEKIGSLIPFMVDL